MRRILILLLYVTFGGILQAQQVLRVPRKQQDRWLKTLIEGGMRRWDNDYLTLDCGAISSLASMNYVDGYKWGLQGIALGRIFTDCSRIELRPRVMWAQDRHVWMGGATLRYHITPSRYGFVEVNGGKWTEDFDRNPVLTEQANSLFSSLFGWNHAKLYERINAEIRGSIALTGVVQFSGYFNWEQRELMENHRLHGLTKAKGEPNVPENYIIEPQFLDLRTAPQFRWNLWTAGFQIDYVPGRKIHVLNDVDAETSSSLPIFSLRVESGWNRPDADDVNRGFLSVDLSAAYIFKEEKNPHELRTFAAMGGYLIRKDVDLMDFRHFDAQAFSWGEHKDRAGYAFNSRTLGDLPQFALLKNYELSTDRCWLEAHAEWNIGGQGLSRWIAKHGVHDYLQLHTVKVDGAPIHTELDYGIDVIQRLRLGVALGINDGKWDGAAFTFNAKL